MVETRQKILVIRFSSIGDIVQCLNVPSLLKNKGFEVHFLTKTEMAELAAAHPKIDKLWLFDKRQGFWGLLKLAFLLRNEHFSHIFDAHNNLRSTILRLFLTPPLHLQRLFLPPIVFSKPHRRWQKWLHLRRRMIPADYSAQLEFLKPLSELGIKAELPAAPQIFTSPSAALIASEKWRWTEFVALAPSANYDLKRWPLHHWKHLIREMQDLKFVVLGGKGDLFLETLQHEFPQQVVSLVGKTSLAETIATLEKARAVVSNDTGILHIADQLGKPALGLQGPTAFGNASRASSKNLRLNLECQPCSKFGKNRCKNPKPKQCLEDLSPQFVAKELRQIL